MWRLTLRYIVRTYRSWQRILLATEKRRVRFLAASPVPINLVLHRLSVLFGLVLLMFRCCCGWCACLKMYSRDKQKQNVTASLSKAGFSFQPLKSVTKNHIFRNFLRELCRSDGILLFVSLFSVMRKWFPLRNARMPYKFTDLLAETIFLLFNQYEKKTKQFLHLPNFHFLAFIGYTHAVTQTVKHTVHEPIHWIFRQSHGNFTHLIGQSDHYWRNKKSLFAKEWRSINILWFRRIAKTFRKSHNFEL